MDEISEHSDLLTLSEAAGLVRVSEETFGDMVRAGRIPSRKVGRERRFSRSALDAWLDGEAAGTVEARKDAAAEDAPSAADASVQRALPISGFCDTAFSENHDRTLHRWVPWIAGFSSSFVAGVLHEARSGRRKLRVLDPFSGVGTTLIEALRHGDDAIGFEINPYAALACRAKCGAAHYDAEVLEAMLARFEDYSERKSRSGEGTVSAPPAGFRSRAPFFSPSVEQQVLACLDFVADEKTGWLNDLFRVALGAVMVSFSNYSYEPSLGTRAAGRQGGRRAGGRIRHRQAQAAGDAGRHRDLPEMDVPIQAPAAFDRSCRILPGRGAPDRAEQHRRARHLASVPQQLSLRSQYETAHVLARNGAAIRRSEEHRTKKFRPVLADRPNGSEDRIAAATAPPEGATGEFEGAPRRERPLWRTRMGELCRRVLQ